MGKMAEGHAAIICDLFIASGEGNRLEAKEADGLGIVEGKLNDAPNLLIVDAVDNGRDRNDINTGVMQIVNGAKLYIEQVADLTMRVGGVADTIKLQVRVT